MKKILFFLLLSGLVFGQNRSRDTIIEKTPVAIIKLGKHKIYIMRKSDQKPYIQQKDGSYTSEDTPYISIRLESAAMKMKPQAYIKARFDDMDEDGKWVKSLPEISGRESLVYTEYFEKEKKIFKSAYFPLKDRFIVLYFTIFYENDDDKKDLDFGIDDFLENGLIIIEDYYLHHKI